MAKNEFDLYKITDQVKRTDITKTGETKELMEVFFETKSGVSDSISIPIEEFNEDTVKDKIKARASTIEALQGASE